LLAQFDNMVEAYGFDVVDASGSIEEVFEDLKQRIMRVVEPERALGSGKSKK
jgi:hypothetical protein